MWNGFCGDVIRRTNQRLLIVVLVIVAGLIIFFGLNRAYFIGFFTGPKAVSNPVLVDAKSPADFSNAIVSLQGGATANARLSEITKDDSHPEGYVSARYVTTDVGGKFLLVRVDPSNPLAQDNVDPSQSEPTGNFTGQVQSFSTNIGAIVDRRNQEGANYLPYFVDASDYQVFGWVSCIICGFLALAAALGAFGYFQRNSNPAAHPFAKSLARFGALESIVPQLDAEMAAAHSTFSYRANTAQVTTHWYVTTLPFVAKAAPLNSLVWVYRRIVKRRVYFVIPAGTQQSLVCFDRYGQNASIQLKAAQIDQLLPLLKNVAPQAIYGYDKRVYNLWRAGRKSFDRSGFPTEARTLVAGQPLPEAMTARKYSY